MINFDNFKLQQLDAEKSQPNSDTYLISLVGNDESSVSTATGYLSHLPGSRLLSWTLPGYEEGKEFQSTSEIDFDDYSPYDTGIIRAYAGIGERERQRHKGGIVIHDSNFPPPSDKTAINIDETGALFINTLSLTRNHSDSDLTIQLKHADFTNAPRYILSATPPAIEDHTDGGQVLVIYLQRDDSSGEEDFYAEYTVDEAYYDDELPIVLLDENTPWDDTATYKKKGMILIHS